MSEFVKIAKERIGLIKYLVERAYNKQVSNEYYEVLDLLFEIRELLNEILGDEE